MSTYEVKYTQRADRDLGKLPPEIAREVIQNIDEIREEPYHFIKKIKASNPKTGAVNSVRIRRGVRAFISIHDDVLIIHVLEVEYP